MVLSEARIPNSDASVHRTVVLLAQLGKNRLFVTF